MNFLPENYESPKTSNYYVKLQDGETRIRILSTPIMGWEDWTEEKKPIRFKFENKPIKSIDPKKPIKHFWAFIVFNYNNDEIQIMNITQATIRKKIEALCKDTDWGAPYHYDIKITKSGSEMNTEYVVNPAPHRPTDSYIIEMFKERPCWLEDIFENKDPFSNEYNKFTPMAVSFSQHDEPTKKETIKIETISVGQAHQLDCIFNVCDPDYVKKCWERFSLFPVKINSLVDLPLDLYDRIYESAVKNYEEFKKEEFTLF